MRLVMLGPQGAGKGTQSARLSEKYDIASIATGDMFRWAIAQGTEVGRKAQEYVSAGKLVPDDVTIEVVRERIEAEDCKQGFLLDGFPRNLAQAEALDDILAASGHRIDAAIVIEVPEEVSLHRIMGRRVCGQCGRNYHLDAPPQSDWTCDRCGGEVAARADDQNEDVIRERLRVYYDRTEPLKQHYRKLGVLREIDGVGSPDEVFNRIVADL